jgi:hypothetical protein
MTTERPFQEVFRERLLRLWSEAEDVRMNTPLWHQEGDLTEDYTAWSGATKDLLMGLGMRWDNEKDDYTFEPEPPLIPIERPVLSSATLIQAENIIDTVMSSKTLPDDIMEKLTIAIAKALNAGGKY